MNPKKLLFIIPPATSKERFGIFSAIGTLYPLLGLAYLAAYAEQAGFRVKIIDAEANNYTENDIIAMTRAYQPNLIGMQAYCTNIQKLYRIAEQVKKTTATKIVLGGPQATLEPSTIVSNQNIDFVIYGEGEKTLIELLHALDNGNYASVLGLAYKEKRGVKINGPRELIQDLDTIPLPARHLLPMEKYHSSANLRGKRTLNLITSRGCCYRCAYCAGSLIFGKTHRFHSTQRVVEEIRTLQNKYCADSIQFYDETFTLNRKRVMELCTAILKEKICIEWSCFTRVNLVDEELLHAMKQAGCYLIFYGLESGVQRLLDLINKDITLEQIEQAIKITHKQGIETWASFMLGLPSETKEDTLQTINFALKINPTFVQFPITTPFPGTQLYDLALRSGKFVKDFENFTTWDEVVFESNGRTAKEIEKIAKTAYRKFYLRPTYILRISKSIVRLPFLKLLALMKTAVLTFLN